MSACPNGVFRVLYKRVSSGRDLCLTMTDPCVKKRLLTGTALPFMTKHPILNQVSTNPELNEVKDRRLDSRRSECRNAIVVPNEAQAAAASFYGDVNVAGDCARSRIGRTVFMINSGFAPRCRRLSSRMRKGSCRIKEYYPEIQLTKFKANFQIKQMYLLKGVFQNF
jgi:hypothetical protein